MAEAAQMPRQTAHPKVREDDARGCPPGGGCAEGANGGRIGNPPFEATAEMRRDVEAWVRAGATGEDIAVLLTASYSVPVSRATVDRHFKSELAVGRARLKVAIGGKLVKQALEGDKTSQIFWLRTQAKWNVRVEHTGADGGPIRTYDLAALGLDDKRVLLAVIDQLLGQHGGEGAAHGDTAGQRTALN